MKSLFTRLAWSLGDCLTCIYRHYVLNLGNRCRDSSGPDASSIGNPRQWSRPQSPAQGHRNSSLHHLPPASHVDLFGRCWFDRYCADVLKSRPGLFQAFHVQAAVGQGTWAQTGSSPETNERWRKIKALRSLSTRLRIFCINPYSLLYIYI